jgi:hypothetical protein
VWCLNTQPNVFKVIAAAKFKLFFCLFAFKKPNPFMLLSRHNTPNIIINPFFIPLPRCFALILRTNL